MNNQETEGTTNNVDPASVDRVVHTPGPWRPGRADKSYDAGIPDNAFAIFAERQHQQDCGLQGNAAVICVIAKPERITLEDIANAKLISESPEMFKVIEIIANATGDTDLEYAQELSQEILMRLKVV